jgi:ParB-like chromosome segregation protein Spo0J
VTPYQIMPDLSEEDYNALKANIGHRGILVPIVVDEKGCILDGHHRKRIADELGISCPQEMRSGLPDADKVELVVAFNIARRHLTREQKQAVIDRLLQDAPEKSNRQVARVAAVDHKTVAKLRLAKERRGDITHVAKRTDTKGRQQPVSTPAVALEPTPAKSSQATPRVDPEKVRSHFAEAAVAASLLVRQSEGQTAANDAHYFALRAASLLRQCLPHLTENDSAALLHKYGISIATSMSPKEEGVVVTEKAEPEERRPPNPGPIADIGRGTDDLMHEEAADDPPRAAA